MLIDIHSEIGLPSLEAMPTGLTKRNSIKAVFDYYFRQKAFDRMFLRKVVETVLEFETRNEEHINFLGSNLLGVYKIKYVTADEDHWIDEVIDLVDWGEMEDEVHDLDGVDKSFFVAGSVLNMSYAYLAHRFYTSSMLSKDDQEKGAGACIKLLHYKFLASVTNHFFPFKTQESIALALYESLTRKSLLKRYHTWGRLVDARVADTVGTSSIHNKTLTNFSPDKSVLYLITDISSRIREIIKKLNRDYRKLRDEDARITSESKYVTIDGDKTLKNFENKAQSIIRDFNDIVKDRINFIRDALVEQTLKLVPTADKRYLIQSLELLSLLANGKQRKDIELMVERLVIHIQEYIKSVDKKDANLIGLVVKFRNMYRSSQLTNEDIIYARKIVSDVVDKALKNKSSGIVSSTRISTLLYITLRILTIEHFR